MSTDGASSSSKAQSQVRVYKVRRQMPYLTRYSTVSAGCYGDLVRAIRSELGFPDTADLRILDVKRYTELKPNTDLSKFGEELGVSLASEPRVSPAKQKDVIAALKASLSVLHVNAKLGKFGYAEVSLDWRFESQQPQPLFCSAVQLLSYPPYVDYSYPVDWQRIIALRFQDAFERYFVIHWCHQHVMMCIHPSDVAAAVAAMSSQNSAPTPTTATRGGVPIARLGQADLDGLVSELKDMDGATFWETVCSISKRNHKHGGTQSANFFSEKMDPDYFPAFRGTTDADTAVSNAISALIKTGSAPDLPQEWCKSHISVFGFRTACGLNLMHCACYANRPQWLRLIHTYAKQVGLGIDDLGGACFLTPMAIAAKLGHLESVAECAALGANVNAKTGAATQKDVGATALFLAAREGRITVCDFLIRVCRADVNAVLDDGSSSLAATRVPEIVKLLISHGATVDTLVTKTNNMLWTGYEKDPALELLTLFLAAGGAKIVNQKAGYMDETPLSHICQTYGVRNEQALECARLLVKAGADVNCTNKDGVTPLQTVTAATWAPTAGELTEKFVELLLGAGASWRHVDGKQGKTPLERCIERGDWASVKHFVAFGAPLTRHQRQEIARRADPSMAKAIAESGEKFLKLAKEKAKEEDLGMNRLLIELGEDPNAGKKGKKKEKTNKKKKGTKKGQQIPAQRKSALDEKQQQQQPQSDSDDETEHESHGEPSGVKYLVDLSPGGPLTVIAASSSVPEEPEGGSESQWLEVGKKKAREKKPHKAQSTPAQTPPLTKVQPQPQPQPQQSKPKPQSTKAEMKSESPQQQAPLQLQPQSPQPPPKSAAEELYDLRRSEALLRQQLAEAKRIAGELSGRVHELESLGSSANARLQELATELAMRQEACTELSSETSRLRLELENSRSECRRLKEQLDASANEAKQQSAPVTSSTCLLDLDRWLAAHASSSGAGEHQQLFSFGGITAQQVAAVEPVVTQPQPQPAVRAPSPYWPAGMGGHMF